MFHKNYIYGENVVGMELRAIFVSTSEYVTAEGKSKNPTKSPSDRHVFNTLLTRSKSLVVAIGSPLHLLRMESHGELDHGWSFYMSECLKNDTFIVPTVVASRSKQEEFKIELKTKLIKASEL